MTRELAAALTLFVVPSWTSAQVIESGVTSGVVQGRQNGLPARDARPATGRSTIGGRVTTDGSQPVRRATVRVMAPELRVSRIMLTDADGRYQFGELPAGRYSINASKATFVTWSYGQTQLSLPGKPLLLADNEVAGNIDIRLPRGAVITGRISDEFGDPM